MCKPAFVECNYYQSPTAAFKILALTSKVCPLAFLSSCYRKKKSGKRKRFPAISLVQTEIKLKRDSHVYSESWTISLKRRTNSHTKASTTFEFTFSGSP